MVLVLARFKNVGPEVGGVAFRGVAMNFTPPAVELLVQPTDNSTVVGAGRVSNT
jgi:hypothetical protein